MFLIYKFLRKKIKNQVLLFIKHAADISTCERTNCAAFAVRGFVKNVKNDIAYFEICFDCDMTCDDQRKNVLW